MSDSCISSSEENFYEKFDLGTSSALRFLNGMKLTIGLSTAALVATFRPHATMLERAVEAGTAVVLSLTASYLGDKAKDSIYDALSNGPKVSDYYADRYTEKYDSYRNSLLVSPLGLLGAGIFISAIHTKEIHMLYPPKSP